MKLLVDTHVLVWAALNSRLLPETVKARLTAEDNIVFVSMASLWELSIKSSLGKIELTKDFFEQLQPVGYEILPIAVEHVKAVNRLPHYHRDPFDRMLVAQAMQEQLIFLTCDDQIKKYDVKVLWD